MAVSKAGPLAALDARRSSWRGARRSESRERWAAMMTVQDGTDVASAALEARRQQAEQHQAQEDSRRLACLASSLPAVIAGVQDVRRAAVARARELAAALTVDRTQATATPHELRAAEWVASDEVMAGPVDQSLARAPAAAIDEVVDLAAGLSYRNPPDGHIRLSAPVSIADGIAAAVSAWQDARTFFDSFKAMRSVLDGLENLAESIATYYPRESTTRPVGGAPASPATRTKHLSTDEEGRFTVDGKRIGFTNRNTPVMRPRAGKAASREARAVLWLFREATGETSLRQPRLGSVAWSNALSALSGVKVEGDGERMRIAEEVTMDEDLRAISLQPPS